MQDERTNSAGLNDGFKAYFNNLNPFDTPLKNSLALLSWFATTTGLWDVTGVDLVGKGIATEFTKIILVVGVSTAIIFAMVTALNGLLGVGRKRGPAMRVAALGAYLFFAAWSIGFGYGFFWKTIAAQEFTKSQFDRNTKRVQETVDLVIDNLSPAAAAITQVAEFSAERAEKEDREGGSCDNNPNVGSGQGPLYRARMSYNQQTQSIAGSLQTNWIRELVSRRNGLNWRLEALDPNSAPTVNDSPEREPGMPTSADSDEIATLSAAANGSIEDRRKAYDAIFGRAIAFSNMSNNLRGTYQAQSARDLRTLADDMSMQGERSQNTFCQDLQLANLLKSAANRIEGVPEVARLDFEFLEGRKATMFAFRTLAANLAALFRKPDASGENIQPLGNNDLLALFATVAVDFALFFVSFWDRPPSGRNHRKTDIENEESSQLDLKKEEQAAWNKSARNMLEGARDSEAISEEFEASQDRQEQRARRKIDSLGNDQAFHDWLVDRIVMTPSNDYYVVIDPDVEGASRHRATAIRDFIRVTWPKMTKGQSGIDLTPKIKKHVVECAIKEGVASARSKMDDITVIAIYEHTASILFRNNDNSAPMISASAKATPAKGRGSGAFGSSTVVPDREDPIKADASHVTAAQGSGNGAAAGVWDGAKPAQEPDETDQSPFGFDGGIPPDATAASGTATSSIWQHDDLSSLFPTEAEPDLPPADTTNSQKVASGVDRNSDEVPPYMDDGSLAGLTARGNDGQRIDDDNSGASSQTVSPWPAEDSTQGVGVEKELLSRDNLAEPVKAAGTGVFEQVEPIEIAEAEEEGAPFAGKVGSPFSQKVIGAAQPDFHPDNFASAQREYDKRNVIDEDVLVAEPKRDDKKKGMFGNLFGKKSKR